MSELSELREANRALQSKLDDARSRVFALQPYMQELTEKDVGEVGI